jgi:hypothetical protein
MSSESDLKRKKEARFYNMYAENLKMFMPQNTMLHFKIHIVFYSTIVYLKYMRIFILNCVPQ